LLCLPTGHVTQAVLKLFMRVPALQDVHAQFLVTASAPQLLQPLNKKSQSTTPLV
jgi:hypothetical protein